MNYLNKISKRFLKRTRTRIGVGLTERTEQKQVDAEMFSLKAEEKINAFEKAFTKLKVDESKVKEIEQSSLSKTLMVSIEGEGTYSFKLNKTQRLI